MTDTGEEWRSVETTVEGDRWISYSDAQKYSGLGRTKLWELLSSGSIKGAKVGRAVRISRRSLDEYMRRNAYVDSKK
jgi:excisionase family DNA binding protein